MPRCFHCQHTQHSYIQYSHYLLQANEERNYHVFYEMLAGMNEWDKQDLFLQGAETYYYLNQVGLTFGRKTLKPNLLCQDNDFLQLCIIRLFCCSSCMCVDRVEPVSWRGSLTGRTSCCSSGAWKRLVCIQTSCPLYGLCCRLSSSWGTFVSAPMRCVLPVDSLHKTLTHQ